MKALLGSSLAAGALGLLLSGSALAADALTLKTFNPTTNGIFPTTSTLISGDKDAILVDAQFQASDAQKVVDMVKQSGKHLKAIFISYNDPDYYFGLDVLKKAFPHARIISTPQTAYLIDSSKDAKLKEWKKTLGQDAPTALITPKAYSGDRLELDGHTIDIKKNKHDPQHSYLWIPSLRTVLGGGEFQQGQHIWLADTQDVEGIDKWIARLDRIATLHPRQIIPAHYVKPDFSPGVLEQDKKYLEDFKAAALKSSSSQGIVDIMKEKYPDYGDVSSLEMSAKVFKKEASWKVYYPYPAVGYSATLTAGNQHYTLAFKDNREVSVKPAHANAYTSPYTASAQDQNTFKVSWQNPETGARYLSEQHWDTGKAVTTVTRKDGKSEQLSGTIRLD